MDSVFGDVGAFDEMPALEGSPDGLGAYATPTPEPNSAPPPPQSAAQYGMEPVGDSWDFVEPDDVSMQSAVRSAGFTALFVTVAMGAGIALGGPWGAGAGVLLAGAAANGYRAQKWWGSPDPSEKHEAVVSAVFATFGVGLGGYMAYRAYSSKEG